MSQVEKLRRGLEVKGGGKRESGRIGFGDMMGNVVGRVNGGGCRFVV